MRHSESSNLALENSKSPVFAKSPCPKPKLRSFEGSAPSPNVNLHPKSKSRCSRGATAASASADAGPGYADINAAVRAHAERLTRDEAESAIPEKSKSRREIQDIRRVLFPTLVAHELLRAKRKYKPVPSEV